MKVIQRYIAMEVELEDGGQEVQYVPARFGDVVKHSDHAAREKVLVDALEDFLKIEYQSDLWAAQNKARALLAERKEPQPEPAPPTIEDRQNLTSPHFCFLCHDRNPVFPCKIHFSEQPAPQSDALEAKLNIWTRPELEDEYRLTLDNLARAEQEARTLREQLARIESWCEAYPLDVFPEPDWNEVKRLLGDTLLSQVSAANMRHVVTGVKNIARGQVAKEATNAETND